MYMIKITLLPELCGSDGILHVTDSRDGPYGLSEHSARVFFDRESVSKMAEKVKGHYQLDTPGKNGEIYFAYVEVIGLSEISRKNVARN